MAKRKKTSDSPNDLAVSTSHDVNMPLLNPPDTPASRRKKTATSRIGRACDRCQHRKLACDPAPEGCPPCQRVNAWCTVTDPLTGTPTYRGEFEYLERQVSKQHDDIKALVQRLKDLGEDVSPYEEENPEDQRYQAWMKVKASGDTRPWDREEKQLNVSRHLGSQPLPNGAAVATGGPPVSAPTELPIPLDAPAKDGVLRLPDLRGGLATTDPQNYVGVTMNYPSSGKGAKLNILGWQLDIAQFTGKDVDVSSRVPRKGEPIYDRSYRSFIATAFGTQQRHPHVDLPGREEMLATVGAYLQAVQPFAPLFHAPSTMAMAARVFDEPGYRPSIAEEVCLHMMIATMYHQRARTEENKAPLHAKSDQHYHFALNSLPQLMMGDKLENCQALAVMALHTRSFPAPEVGWMTATMTFNKLIQLGYHRSAKSGSNRRPDRSFIDIEVQKRLFWTMLVILVTASGKLGRPMPVRLEDFDVEVPMPVPDEQVLESGLDPSKPGQCVFLAGIEAQKVAPIYLELYNIMYATKRSSKEYMQFVGIAERRLKGWQDQWPAEFQQPYEKADYGTRVVISYLQFWSLEFKLLLHHPSLSLTKSYQFNENNLRACLEASRDMLGIVKRMKDLHVLDINWYNCAVYLLVIQTMFYGYGQLKEELTRVKIAELRSEMEEWLIIMRDIGKLLGSGKRLHNTVAEQVKMGMSQLEKQLEEQTSARQTKLETPPSEVKQEPTGSALEQHAPTPSGPPIGFGNFTKPREQQQQQHPHQPDSGMSMPYQNNAVQFSNEIHPNLNSFTSSLQYNFSPHQHTPLQAPVPRPPPQVTSAYGGSAAFAQAYAMGMQAHSMQDFMTPPTQSQSAQQQVQGHHPSQGHNPGMNGMFQNTNGQYGPASVSTGDSYGNADSASWYNYTQSIPNAINPHEYPPAATALLQLGGRPDTSMGGMNGGGNTDAHGNGYDGSGMSGNMIWPMGVMDGSHQGNQ